MLKAAAIDVGSSATRLSRLTLSDAGVVVQTDLQRFDMRLGADVFGTGSVSPARQTALVRLFEGLGYTLRKAGITHYRAVATSAMRDALNGVEVCQAVSKASGLNLEIISGTQEGALSRRALVRSLGTVSDEALLVDLGGGSLEIERIDGSVSQSVPMGTVRLLSLFAPLRGPLLPAGLKQVRAAVLARLQDVAGAQPAAAALAIGTGGNLEALAKVLGRTNGLVARFDSAALGDLAERIAPMPMSERVSAFHIRPDRADLFLPAVLVLDALSHIYGVERFVVPRTGLRDALLLDAIQAQTPKLTTDLTPACSVSLALFDLLYPLHGLWAPARSVVFTVAQAFAAWTHKAQHAAPDEQTFSTLGNDVQALCQTALAHLQHLPPPEQPGPIARAGAIVAGVVGLGQALSEGLAPQAAQSLIGRLRLDVVGEPACLFVGQAIRAELTRPLARALGRELVLA